MVESSVKAKLWGARVWLWLVDWSLFEVGLCQEVANLLSDASSISKFPRIGLSHSQVLRMPCWAMDPLCLCLGACVPLIPEYGGAAIAWLVTHHRW